MYVLSAHDGFTKASTVQATEQCTLVSGSGNVKNLDVLYVGSGFTNISKYDAYVQGSAGTLLGFKPFDANKARLNVWRLNELTNFDCTILEPRMFSCSSAKIAQKRVTCPNDQVILVVDSNEWRGFGNVGGDISGTSSWKDMPYSVVLHEFGHAFGGLHDEYVYDAGQFAVDMNAPNCDAVACTKFTAAGVRGCFAGCGASTRYRSINNGMMRDLGATEFGQYDEKIIVDKLRGYG
jgi:hypothetical protein